MWDFLSCSINLTVASCRQCNFSLLQINRGKVIVHEIKMEQSCHLNRDEDIYDIYAYLRGAAISAHRPAEPSLYHLEGSSGKKANTNTVPAKWIHDLLKYRSYRCSGNPRPYYWCDFCTGVMVGESDWPSHCDADHHWMQIITSTM